MMFDHQGRDIGSEVWTYSGVKRLRRFLSGERNVWRRRLGIHREAIIGTFLAVLAPVVAWALGQFGGDS